MGTIKSAFAQTEGSEKICRKFENYIGGYKRYCEIWDSPSCNYLIKVYNQRSLGSNFDKQTFHYMRTDIVMQEVCKDLAHLYNGYFIRPPKSIDILHSGLLELPEQRHFYHYEAYIQGDFHKWNGNNGWIDDVHIRHTPSAFSFFTFRYTKCSLMVVDVQGNLHLLITIGSPIICLIQE